MTMVVASLLEIANDHPVLLVLMVLALASMGGGVPPMIERRRRRAIERGLPTLLESLSDSIGAGLEAQQAMKAQADSNDRLGALIHHALEDGEILDVRSLTRLIGDSFEVTSGSTCREPHHDGAETGRTAQGPAL